MFHVFLVEDEKNLNELLVSYLRKESWDVTSFLGGGEALIAIQRGDKPHLWILDVMLPDVDGFELLREIKERSTNVPIIFISARDADLDRILGLELGSDDYLAKPFLPRELVIRAKKILHRVYGQPIPTEKKVGKVIGPYTIDEQRRLAFEQDVVIDLTSKEFDLLLVFVNHPGQAFSREQLLELVWGDDYFGSDRAVDDLVRRLRKKVVELRVETIYGFGYRLDL